VPNPETTTAIPNALSAPVEETVKETVQTTAPLTVMPPAPFIPAPEPVTAEPALREVEPAYTPPAEVVAMPVAVVEVETPQIQPVAVAVSPPAPAPAPVKLDWPSDLQQVETSRDRLQAAARNADDVAPRRVKRVRPPVEHVSTEPLQQVETRG
jgi:hypothetical protein